MEEQAEPMSCHGTEAGEKMAHDHGPSKSFGGTVKKGITTINPVFVLLLGLCPTLAVSTSLDNAIGMAGATFFVLFFSSLLISLIRKWVPEMVRIPTFIVIIASLVTIIFIIFQAYIPPLAKSLGIYVPLIVVNCIILGRAEAFASKNPVKLTVGDAAGIGIGFSGAILLISFIRQLFGTGAIEMFGSKLFTVPGLVENPVSVFILPMGAFLVIGLLLALFRYTGVMESE